MPVRIKARFAGNGRSLAKKRNAESRRHRGSRRAAADQNVDLSEARLGFLQKGFDARVVADVGRHGQYIGA
ncbi:MAG TPA: hypothetical protein VJ902_02750, partial [Wenzhouxiangellaceae bacterium]|nr:hypothetical protein [Wenzhouxiangellaceae bacterium]